jgi:16S rRNA (guanine(966)-N(2))-methyltransferase RsmD
MRVIAGTLKGRRLAPPRWPGLRPTSDRLRETLFNVIGARVAGARVVDAYAGTGALGLEALSRGAAQVVFVERDPRAVRLVRENLARCGVEGGYAIIRGDFVAAARRRLPAGAFDLVLIDPPYGDAALGEILDAAARIVAPGGLIVLEHGARRPAPAGAGAFPRARTLAAGDSALSFYPAPEHGG